jgi:hypothetical protein
MSRFGLLFEATRFSATDSRALAADTGLLSITISTGAFVAIPRSEPRQWYQKRSNPS